MWCTPFGLIPLYTNILRVSTYTVHAVQQYKVVNSIL